MRPIYISLIAAAVSLQACNNTETTTTENTKTETTTATPLEAPAAPGAKLNQKSLDNLVALNVAYYGLKDALVSSDATQASQAASKVLMTAETMKYELTMDTNSTSALTADLKDLMVATDKLVNAAGEKPIEEQRKYFETVSDKMYAVLKGAEYTGPAVYRQYCPMAFEDKGAYWLSSEEEIRNPYFGKKMMSCGEVKETLK